MRAYLFAIFLSLGLGACTSLVPQSASEQQDHQETLHRYGRFSVLVYDSLQEKFTDSVQGNFEWQSVNHQVVLNLSSPLGQTLARVEVDQDYARLIQSDNTVIEADTPDRLVAMILGRHFPVSGLKYWLKGRPDPMLSLSQEKYDDKRKLTKMHQGPWQIVLGIYDQKGPKRLHLSREEKGEKMTIRVVIDE